MGGQLDGNFLPGSLPHKFVLIVTSIICFVVNKFSLSLFSLSTKPEVMSQHVATPPAEN